MMMKKNTVTVTEYTVMVMNEEEGSQFDSTRTSTHQDYCKISMISMIGH